ncbi:hypothetical protein ACKKBG_A06830 [Auxenochlorella protothecoides x Auxenochlorella symbiontica]
MSQMARGIPRTAARALRGGLARKDRCMRTSAAPKPASLPVLGRDIKVEIKTVQTASRPIRMVVPDVDQVMEYYLSSGQDSRDPYWCAVWPSAVAMSDHLTGMDLRQLSVLEMGCGLGLAGISAALHGAASVRLYDQEPLAVQCALLSAQLNGVPVVQQDPGPPSIELMPDSWWDCLGEGPPRPAAEGCTPVCAAQYDWNSGLGLAPADLVLACDVLYDSAFVEPLARLLPKLLARPGSRLVLTDPTKRTPGHRRQLLERLTGPGADLALMQRTEVEALAGDPPASDVQVLVLQARQPGDTLGVPLDD